MAALVGRNLAPANDAGGDCPSVTRSLKMADKPGIAGKGGRMHIDAINGRPAWADTFAAAFDEWLGDSVGDLEVLDALSFAALESGVAVADSFDVDLGGSLDGDHNLHWPGVYLCVPGEPKHIIGAADSTRLLVAK